MSGDVTPLKLVAVTDEVYLVREEIISMEYEVMDNGYWSSTKGTIITLSNGRKIYISGMKPKDILEKLNAPA
jgi:hypothetical protein